MSLNPGDYIYLLDPYNFTGQAIGTQAVPNQGVTRDSNHNWHITYALLNSDDDFNASGAYGNAAGDPTIDTFRRLTDTQVYMSQNVFNTALTDDYSETFEDVAKITFDNKPEHAT